ncbi:hypothetical protein D9M71_666440 [compost metagenome]
MSAGFFSPCCIFRFCALSSSVLICTSERNFTAAGFSSAKSLFSTATTLSTANPRFLPLYMVSTSLLPSGRSVFGTSSQTTSVFSTSTLAIHCGTQVKYRIGLPSL